MISRLPIRGGVEVVIKSVVTGSLRCASLRTGTTIVSRMRRRQRMKMLTSFCNVLVNRRTLG